MIVVSIDIDRPPQEVFAYLDALERHTEWQDDHSSPPPLAGKHAAHARVKPPSEPR